MSVARPAGPAPACSTVSPPVRRPCADAGAGPAHTGDSALPAPALSVRAAGPGQAGPAAGTRLPAAPSTPCGAGTSPGHVAAGGGGRCGGAPPCPLRPRAGRAHPCRPPDPGPGHLPPRPQLPRQHCGARDAAPPGRRCGQCSCRHQASEHEDRRRVLLIFLTVRRKLPAAAQPEAAKSSLLFFFCEQYPRGHPASVPPVLSLPECVFSAQPLLPRDGPPA